MQPLPVMYNYSADIRSALIGKMGSMEAVVLGNTRCPKNRWTITRIRIQSNVKSRETVPIQSDDVSNIKVQNVVVDSSARIAGPVQPAENDSAACCVTIIEEQPRTGRPGSELVSFVWAPAR